MSTRIPCECRGYSCGCGASPREAYVMVDRVDVGRINVCDRCDLTRDTRVGEPVARTEKPRPQQTHEWSALPIADEARCSCGRAVTGEFLTGVVLERLRVDTAQFQPPCRDALVAFVTEWRRPPTGSRRPKDNVTIVMGDGMAHSRVRPKGSFRDSMPRFQVKPASEMREGEPYVDAGDHPEEEWTPGDIRDATRDPEAWRYSSDDHEWLSFLVDTHSPEWKAFDAAWGKAEYGVSYAEPAVLPEIAKPQEGGGLYDKTRSWPVAKPQGPTDAEIVEAWDSVMRGTENQNWLMRRCPDVMAVTIGARGVTLTKAEYQAARSRELARKQAEAREAERQRVACQGDWPGENEFDA